MITKKTVLAHAFAIEAHKNQLYGKLPYHAHLTYVVMTALRFIHNIEQKLQEEVIQSCWLHDTNEDSGITYGEIKKHFGEFVANVVYAVTNEKGKDRREKFERTMPSLSKNRHAVFVKLCDKIANTSYSKMESSSMYDAYVSEYKQFKKFLYVKGEYEDMWNELDNISVVVHAEKPVELMVGHSEK